MNAKENRLEGYFEFRAAFVNVSMQMKRKRKLRRRKLRPLLMSKKGQRRSRMMIQTLIKTVRNCNKNNSARLRCNSFNFTANPEGGAADQNEGGEEEGESLHCRGKDVVHPVEGRSIAAGSNATLAMCIFRVEIDIKLTPNVSDITLKAYQEAVPYCKMVKKEMRDFIVKDNFSEAHQAYDQAEIDMAENIMWQDVASLG